MFLQFGDVRDIPAAVVKIFGDLCFWYTFL
jgi:hypothetical protein